MTAQTITFEGRTIEVDEYSLPIATETGIRCGSCKQRHALAASVKFCYAMQAEYRAEQEAEIAAERRNERFFEERGYWEALAQDEYERRNGVIDFIDAWHMESPETCPCEDH